MTENPLTLESCLHKTCIVGLSYFDSDENLLKQNLLGGKVVEVDTEKGITLLLLNAQNKADKSHEAPKHFIIPGNLSCWFVAPTGDYHTSNEAKILNPDYLVTWDIYQTRKDKEDGEQQWWEWRPRTESPNVGDTKNQH